jgi:hypothetical protein
MRALGFVPLIVLAACSGSSQPPKEKAEAPAAEQLQPGQWEMTTEVTSLTKADQGTPRINTPAGTRLSSSVCVPPAAAKKPPPALFATREDSCTYKDFYMSGGRLNASLDCKRRGLNGQVGMNVNGSYTATTIEGTVGITTYLATDGDVRIESRLTGRRTGECTAEPAAEGKAGS